LIAIDIETYEYDLDELGDSSMRDNGSQIVCIGLYDGKDSAICEPDDPYLKDWLASDEPKVFHNGVYDLSWLCCSPKYNFTVNGTIHDTMTRATYIDEYADLDLDSCCKRLGVVGKNKEDTLEAWGKANGIKDVIKYLPFIWREKNGRAAIEKYCLQDCKATYDLWQAQEIYLREYKESYQLECDLFPVILEMKRNGVRLDIVARDRYTEQIERDNAKYWKILTNDYGITPAILRSPKQLGTIMNANGIVSPVKTKKGAQSWGADALIMVDHPIVETLQKCKINQSLLDKYMYSALSKNLIGDRIHCTFSPNKRDDGGTITGRFASKNPNMQNIPARDFKHGKEMRELFIPEEGCMMGAFDYSQIEYLLLAHYAVGPQAEWFRAQAQAGIDFHTVAMEMTGIKKRDTVKTLNYGIIYGMGKALMLAKNRKLFTEAALELGITPEEYADKTFQDYHGKLRVVKDTMQWFQNECKKTGIIYGIGGRPHHKPKPAFIDGRMNDFIYKITNYALQGSAAEILKVGLRDAWKAGCFNVLMLHLTVHDENVVSIPYNKIGTEAAVEMQRCMNNSFIEQLRVPMKAVGEVGPNWGYWSSDIWEDMQKGVFDKWD
jgi:DNA polymerase-1